VTIVGCVAMVAVLVLMKKFDLGSKIFKPKSA
jgi:hypothetical protein